MGQKSLLRTGAVCILALWDHNNVLICEEAFGCMLYGTNCQELCSPKMAAVIFTGAKLLQHQNGIIGIACIRTNNYSKDNTKVYNLASLKRGTGGRSSFSGIVATVFGATGFVGRYICNRLGKIGSQIIIPYRGDASEVLRFRLCGDLGQVLFQPFQLNNESSIEKAMQYSNVVINLIGRDWETKNYKFDDVHVKGALAIARAAKKCGVERLIHFSALNAAEKPQACILEKGSQFLASKYKGEKAVLECFPDATIIRPADIYGQEDRFLRYFAHAWRRQYYYMPLWKKGECTIKQPVHVSDVAAAVIAALRDPDSVGKIYQAVGPKRYQLSELVDWFYRIMHRDAEWGYWRYDMRYDPLFKLRVTLSNAISPSYPIGNLHWERIERECVTDVVEPGVPTLEDLGVSLMAMENQVPWELKPFIADLYYDKDADEPSPPAAPPKFVV